MTTAPSRNCLLPGMSLRVTWTKASKSHQSACSCTEVNNGKYGPPCRVTGKRSVGRRLHPACRCICRCPARCAVRARFENSCAWPNACQGITHSKAKRTQCNKFYRTRVSTVVAAPTVPSTFSVQRKQRTTPTLLCTSSIEDRKVGVSEGLQSAISFFNLRNEIAL